MADDNASVCFQRAIGEADVAMMRSWADALGTPDPDRDVVLSAAGIGIDGIRVERTKRGRIAVAQFDVAEPERAMRVLDASNEPWTRAFWAFLQEATPAHPEPISPLDRLLNDAHPSWGTLAGDLGHT